MNRVVVFSGSCLVVNEDKKMGCLLKIIEIYEKNYEISIQIGKTERLFTFNHITIVSPEDNESNINNKTEIWSFESGFGEEVILKLSNETSRKLKFYSEQNNRKHYIPQSKGINPSQFYSSSSSTSSLFPHFNQHKTIIQECNIETLDISKIFHRQSDAFLYFDEIYKRQLSTKSKNFLNLKVFSFESITTGQRKFLVCDYDVFFNRYIDTNNTCNTINNSKVTDTINFIKIEDLKTERHYYEIIRENCPCRAYFDLEYQKEYNPLTNGDDLTATWISLVVWKISELFGIELSKENIIVLDSSTAKKYSKHLVIILPEPVSTPAPLSNFSNMPSNNQQHLNCCDSVIINEPHIYSSNIKLDTKSHQNRIYQNSENNQSKNYLQQQCQHQFNTHPSNQSNTDTFTSKEALFRSNIAVGSLVDLILQDITEMSTCTAIPIGNTASSSNDNNGSNREVSDGCSDNRFQDAAASIDTNRSANSSHSCNSNSNIQIDHNSNNDERNNNNANTNNMNGNNSCNDNSTTNIETSSTSASYRRPKRPYDALWVLKENNKKVFFVDLGVYTRNR